MAKGQLTRQELEEKQKRLESEIEKLKAVIKASDTTTFEIIIEDIKREMSANIAEEDWKSLKKNACKVDKFREIVKIIQNQNDLLEQKKDELQDTVWELEHYQTSLFEETPLLADGTCESTGFKDSQSCEIETGDVYKSVNDNGEISYYLVKKSVEKDNSYSIISNTFDDELLLNYPKNRELILNSDYVGNIYLSKSEQTPEEAENALIALRLIGACDDKNK